MVDCFFYGTLRDPALLRRVLGDVPDHRRLHDAVLSGWRAVYRKGAWYPILVADEQATTPGLVMDGVRPVERQRLIDYEGPDYRLSPLYVDCQGRERTVMVFMPVRRVQGTADTWNLADWQRRFKPRVFARWGTATPPDF